MISPTSPFSRWTDRLPAIFFGGAILYFARPILVPLSFSLLISFILYPVCDSLEKRRLPRALAIGLGLFMLLAIVLLVGWLLAGQVHQFQGEWPLLKERLIRTYGTLQQSISRSTPWTIEQQDVWLKKTMSDSSGSIALSLKSFSYEVVKGFVLLILIPLLSAMFLYGRERWFHALTLLLPSVDPAEIKSIVRGAVHAYYEFIKGMGIVYLAVGTLNSIGLALIGIPHPVLFGFIASILTFIPYVGIMVASLLPIAVSWITYDSVWYPLGVIAVFTLVQYLEANLIFPLAVSNRLDINTPVTIIAILLGGMLWGAAGMILFVPFAGITKLIAERTPKGRALAFLLGNEPDKG